VISLKYLWQTKFTSLLQYSLPEKHQLVLNLSGITIKFCEFSAAGTAAKFNSPSAAIFFPSRVFIDPTYGGIAGSGSDHAILIFNNPFSVVGEVTFATTRGIPGSYIWLTGYGISGNRTDGYLGQTGDLRAGTSRLGFGDLTDLGYNDNQYFRGSFRPFPEFTTDIRGSNGDSGGPSFDNNFSINPTINNVLGLNIAASNTISGTSTILLDFTNPHTSAFRDSVFSEIGATAVPQPCSLALLLILSIAGAARFRFKNKVRRVSDCNLRTVRNPVNTVDFFPN
jgi:hypothetical protein